MVLCQQNFYYVMTTKVLKLVFSTEESKCHRQSWFYWSLEIFGTPNIFSFLIQNTRFSKYYLYFRTDTQFKNMNIWSLINFSYFFLNFKKYFSRRKFTIFTYDSVVWWKFLFLEHNFIKLDWIPRNVCIAIT